MYMRGEHHLGQAPQEKPWYTDLFGAATTAYEAYAQRERDKAAQDMARRKAEAEVKIEAMKIGLVPRGYTRYLPQDVLKYIPPGIQTAFRSVGGADWVMPVAIGAVGLGALFLFMKK